MAASIQLLCGFWAEFLRQVFFAGRFGFGLVLILGTGASLCKGELKGFRV